MAYKKVPLNKEQIQELKQNPLWNELVTKFGEENVTNNYVVDYVILQEEKNVYAKDGTRLDISPELIRKVYDVNQSIFDKYVNAPINKIKSFMSGEEALGHIPVIEDHDSLMIKKHGAIVPGSFKLVNMDDKLHLMCKAVLISPEAKWGYVTGNWREVSPTILSSYKIAELSYVPFPAQMNNSSLSSGENVMQQSQDLTEFEMKLAEAKAKAEEEKRHNQLRRKEFTVTALTEKLINKGVIASGKRNVVEGALMQLGDGESHLVASLLQKVGGKSPLLNKPRNVFLKGAIEMSTQAERFDNFKQSNANKYSTAVELIEAFQLQEADYQKSLQLASGEGEVSDPKAKYNDIIDLLEKDEEVDAEIKEKLVSLCASKFGLKLASGDTEPGGQVNAGGAEHANNTSLGDGAEVLSNKQDTYAEMLEKGYQTMKSENANLKSELDSIKAQLSNIKSTLGLDSIKAQLSNIKSTSGA